MQNAAKFRHCLGDKRSELIFNSVQDHEQNKIFLKYVFLKDESMKIWWREDFAISMRSLQLLEKRHTFYVKIIISMYYTHKKP